MVTPVQYGFQRIILRLLSILIVPVLVSCGGAGGSGTTDSVNKAALDKVSDADRALLHAVYFDQRTPSGFYHAPIPAAVTDASSYTIHHIKNTSILSVADRVNQPQYELSAVDLTEALNWSETAASLLPVYRQLVDEDETKFYYQFARVDMNAPDIYYYDRVLKRSVISRSGVDLSVPSVLNQPIYMGQVNLSALSLVDIQQLIEYLWSFSKSNNFGHAVVSTFITEDINHIIYTMEEARLTPDYSGQCDQVSVYRISYSIEKPGGRMTRSTVLLRHLFARREAAQIVSCIK